MKLGAAIPALDDPALDEKDNIGSISRWFWVANGALTAFAGSLVFGSLLPLLKTGTIHEHWSRFIVITFCLSIVTLPLINNRSIECVFGLVRERMQYWRQFRKPWTRF
jgi:hypothetical protein